MEPRLASGVWVAAYLARLRLAAIPAYVMQKGDATAGAVVVKPNGETLTGANIGMALATRDLMQDLRSADPFRQGGGKSFSKSDRSRFLDTLDRTLRASLRR